MNQLSRPLPRPLPWASIAELVRLGFGLFFVAMSLLNLLLTLPNPALFYEIAALAALPAYRQFTAGWVLEHAQLFTTLLIAFEASVGLLMLGKGRAARLGLLAGAIFCLALVPAIGWYTAPNLGIALLLIGLARHEPERGLFIRLLPAHPQWIERLKAFMSAWTLVLIGLPLTLLALGLLFYGVFRPIYQTWGARPAELSMTLPGDELVPEPNLLNTRAITIRATPEVIYPWLIQMGWGRAGLYSYEGLENLIGSDLHNADSIHPEWQDTQVGDIIWFGPEPKNYPHQYVIALEPNRYMLLWGGAMAEDGVTPLPSSGDVYVNATWLFYLDPQADGTTRLIVRGRNAHSSDLLSIVMWDGITDPLNALMEERLMRGIRDRVEGR